MGDSPNYTERTVQVNNKIIVGSNRPLVAVQTEVSEVSESICTCYVLVIKDFLSIKKNAAISSNPVECIYSIFGL